MQSVFNWMLKNISPGISICNDIYTYRRSWFVFHKHSWYYTVIYIGMITIIIKFIVHCNIISWNRSLYGCIKNVFRKVNRKLHETASVFVIKTCAGAWICDNTILLYYTTATMVYLLNLNLNSHRDDFGRSGGTMCRYYSRSCILRW